MFQLDDRHAYALCSVLLSVAGTLELHTRIIVNLDSLMSYILVKWTCPARRAFTASLLTASEQSCACAAQGIHWVLEYYYRGVASWTWFYPHHYAPMVSDIAGVSDFRIAFEPGRPFLPFQQLLSVLPAASCRLLPAPYQVRANRVLTGCPGSLLLHILVQGHSPLLTDH